MKRKISTKLIEWKDKPDRKPLLLYGARQVGKTTILGQFGKDHFTAIHSINFEKNGELGKIFEKSLDPAYIIREIEYALDKEINPATDLLLFDEIQACPLALTSLKYFAEDMPQLALCAAGSLLGVYLGPVSFPVGKVDIMTLYPMNFEEFLLALGETRLLGEIESMRITKTISEMAHVRLFERLLEYFVVGGLPEVVKTFCQERHHLTHAFTKVREKQATLIETYLADIAKHSGKVNAMHIARIWESVPTQLARTQDGGASKFKFQGVVPGIDRYSRLANAIDWLEAAKLIIKVPIVNSGNLPFKAYVVENAFKLFLFDIGLLGAMSNLSPQTILKYEYGSYKGYFAENFIAQEFLAAGHRDLYSWQEKQAEVEFLCETDSRAIPIEVKSGWVTQSKSANVFSEKYSSPYRVIFSAKRLSFSNVVKHYPLYSAGWFPLNKIEN